MSDLACWHPLTTLGPPASEDSSERFTIGASLVAGISLMLGDQDYYDGRVASLSQRRSGWNERC